MTRTGSLFDYYDAIYGSVVKPSILETGNANSRLTVRVTRELPVEGAMN
jgi:hypothetical protein